MPSLFRRLLGVLAGSSQAELRRQNQFLRAENEILRSKIPGPIRVTPQERARLLRLGVAVGAAIHSLISIVKPATFLQWVRRASQQPVTCRPRNPGRPRTPEQIRELVLRLARETGWGYTRLVGQMRLLGYTISRSTVIKILKDAGMPTGPERNQSTWDEFVRSYAKSLWACDFLSQRVLTRKGFRDLYAIAFVNVHTRRAFVTPSTLHPDSPWVLAQIEGFERAAGLGREKCRVMTRDRDTKFGRPFDEALRARKITPVQLPHLAPNLNAQVERFIQTVQVDCLDKFLVMGTQHLDHLLREFVAHYNNERPHSSIGFRTPSGRGPPLKIAGSTACGPVRCRVRLGGVLRHFVHAA